MLKIKTFGGHGPIAPPPLDPPLARATPFPAAPLTGRESRRVSLMSGPIAALPMPGDARSPDGAREPTPTARRHGDVERRCRLGRRRRVDPDAVAVGVGPF